MTRIATEEDTSAQHTKVKDRVYKRQLSYSYPTYSARKSSLALFYQLRMKYSIQIIYHIYSNKLGGIYLFQAESLGMRLLEGGRYWRVAIISTSACTHDS